MALPAEASPPPPPGSGEGFLPVEPSLDEVRELAADYNLIALRHTFIDDTETPVSAFLKLRGRRPEVPACLLAPRARACVARGFFLGWGGPGPAVGALSVQRGPPAQVGPLAAGRRPRRSLQA